MTTRDERSSSSDPNSLLTRAEQSLYARNHWRALTPAEFDREMDQTPVLIRELMDALATAQRLVDEHALQVVQTERDTWYAKYRETEGALVSVTQRLIVTEQQLELILQAKEAAEARYQSLVDGLKGLPVYRQMSAHLVAKADLDALLAPADPQKDTP